MSTINDFNQVILIGTANMDSENGHFGLVVERKKQPLRGVIHDVIPVKIAGLLGSEAGSHANVNAGDRIMVRGSIQIVYCVNGDLVSTRLELVCDYFRVLESKGVAA